MSDIRKTNKTQELEARITELEMQITHLESTIDTMNAAMSNLSQDFLLAKEAMQLMNRRLESMNTPNNEKSVLDDTPPPHY